MKNPEIHAVVIGINAFPHLEKGASPRRTAFGFGMEQLTSPVPSALAFTEWLRRDRSHTIPVGSLELLISEAPSNPPDAQRPTCDNIIAALERWKERCNEHPNALGLIHYVGHGFQAGAKDPYLLAEDYGADAGRPMHHAVDLSSVVRIMRRTRAKALCFLIDCCRKNHSGDLPTFLSKQPGARGLNLIRGQDSERDAPCVKVFAVPEGEEAEAPPHGRISYFTEAVLRAFKGMGAENDGGKWVLNTRRFPEGITAAFEYARERDQQEIAHPHRELMGKQNKVEIIHHFHSEHPPIVPIGVACNPGDVTALARMSAIHRKAPRKNPYYKRSPEEGRWDFEAVVGPYRLKTMFPPNCQFQRGDEDESFYPPGRRDYVVEAKRR